MRIKTVIADDEPLARDRVRLLIEADREFEIVQECRNGAEVLNTLSSREVDLLLLDIHMPGLNGSDVLNADVSVTRPRSAWPFPLTF